MPMRESRGSSHEILDHVGELKLRLRADSFADLAAEAGGALGALYLRGVMPGPSGAWREVEVQAPDRGALLVDWLNELIFLAERDRWVPVEFDVREASETLIRARVRGAAVTEAPAVVKAATLHGLRLESTGPGLEAEITLDV